MKSTAIALLFCLVPTFAQTSRKAQSTQKQTPSPLSVPISIQLPSAISVTASMDKPLDVRSDVTKDWKDNLMVALTATLVIIGASGVWYAKRTLDTIEGQLTEIQKAATQTDKMITHAATQAEAAKASADALIHSERAWVIIDKVYPLKLMVQFHGLSGVGANSFRFDIKNIGRTVARLGNIRTMWKLLPREEAALPETPEFWPINGEETIVDPALGEVVAPGETIKGLGAFIFEPFDDDKVNNIKSGSMVLWVYGRIEYFDFAGKEHAMNFSYRYISSMDFAWKPEENFISSGPPQYRAHT